MKIITICNGHKREWDNREQAILFFIECSLLSEGSEKERYLIILKKLKEGYFICNDI